MSGRGTRSAALLILAALAGCAGLEGSSSPLPDADPFLILEADSDTIFRGGNVTLTIRARNRTGETMDFGQGSSSCWFGVRVVEVDSGQSVFLARACTRDYAARYLEPGEVRTETVIWRAQRVVDGEVADLPSGSYQLQATASGRASAPVTVEVVD